MRKIEPSNPNVLSPKQLEAEFGISISKRQKLRMQKKTKKTIIFQSLLESLAAQYL